MNRKFVVLVETGGIVSASTVMSMSMRDAAQLVADNYEEELGEADIRQENLQVYGVDGLTQYTVVEVDE